MSISFRLIFLFILLFNCYANCLSAECSTKRLAFAYLDLDYVKPEYIASCASTANIDGLSLYVRWKTLEPQKGRYDFSKLDVAIQEAAKRRKVVTINLIGTPKTPEWLEREKIQFLTSVSLSRSITVEPVPWDVNYLTLYKKLLNAASIHLKKMNMMPYVFAVTVAAPSQQTSLVNCRHNKIGAVTYDRYKYLTACSQMLDAYHTNFGTARQLITAPQNCMICAPDEDKAFFQELMDYGLRKYGRSCWVLAKDLKASGSIDASSVQTSAVRSALGFQLACGSQETNERGLGGTFPSNFAEAIRHGIADGAIYFEIYGSDVISDNPVIRAAIASIHQ